MIIESVINANCTYTNKLYIKIKGEAKERFIMGPFSNDRLLEIFKRNNNIL